MKYKFLLLDVESLTESEQVGVIAAINNYAMDETSDEAIIGILPVEEVE